MQESFIVKHVFCTEKGRKDMSNVTEIRWHGRGGQGAKTAALLLADVAFQTGK